MAAPKSTMMGQKSPGPEPTPMPTLPEELSPEQYVVWMTGAAAMLGADVPSPEQWQAIRDKTESCVGRVIAEKMLVNHMHGMATTHKLEMDHQIAMAQLKHMAARVQKEPEPIQHLTPVQYGSSSGKVPF